MSLKINHFSFYSRQTVLSNGSTLWQANPTPIPFSLPVSTTEAGKSKYSLSVCLTTRVTEKENRDRKEEKNKQNEERDEKKKDFKRERETEAKKSQHIWIASKHSQRRKSSGTKKTLKNYYWRKLFISRSGLL